jgi:hypothetical protein
VREQWLKSLSAGLDVVMNSPKASSGSRTQDINSAEGELALVVTYKNESSLCLLKHSTMKTYGRVRQLTAPSILNLGTGWTLLVSFTPRPLYPRGGRNPFDRRLGGPQSKSRHCGKVKSCLLFINLTLLHEDIWGSGVTAPPFLISVLDGSGWAPSHPARFTSGGKSPWYLLGRRLCGPQNWFRRCEAEKNLFPLPGIEPRLPSP